MKAYKGFNLDMTCIGFKFEEGKEYHQDNAVLCEIGFHACENPLDTFGYYYPGSSVFHEVELDDVSDERSTDDTKVCAKTIRVGARLDASDMCKAHLEYVRTHRKRTDWKVAGDGKSVSVCDCGSAVSGKRGIAAAGSLGSAEAGVHGCTAAGYGGVSAAGDFGASVAGDFGRASAGSRGSAAAGNCGGSSAGYMGVASAGEYGSAYSGDQGSSAAGKRGIATAGNHGIAAAGEFGSASAGVQGVACCRGGKVKGGMGAVIAASELDGFGRNVRAVAAIVDGKKIKADTWYTVKNGEFVEVKE